MNLDDAISIIESVAGCTDETTPVGEAWASIRAALAQQEPEGLTDEQLITTYQSAYQPAWERGEHYGCHVDGIRAVYDLGRPAPQPVADGEVAEHVRWLNFEAEQALRAGRYFPAEMLTRSAELLAHHHPQPILVSERLPGPGDCAPWPGESDISAWCWVGSFDDGWTWEQRSAGCLAMFPDDFSHWLPAHALSLPTTTENTDD